MSCSLPIASASVRVSKAGDLNVVASRSLAHVFVSTREPRTGPRPHAAGSGRPRGHIKFSSFLATIRVLCPGSSHFIVCFPLGFPSCPLGSRVESYIFMFLTVHRPIHRVRVHDIISLGPARLGRTAQKVELNRGEQQSGTCVPDSTHPDHNHSR